MIIVDFFQSSPGSIDGLEKKETTTNTTVGNTGFRISGDTVYYITYYYTHTHTHTGH